MISIKNTIVTFVDKLLRKSHVVEDAYALDLLSSLMNEGVFLPYTSSALRPFALATIINDIIINNRKHILEFGGGISTLVIARLMRRNSIKGKIYCIEENEDWIKILENQLESEGLEEFVQFILTPLEITSTPYRNIKWYNQEQISKQIPKNSIDMMLVDGPTAYKPEDKFNRYLALPFVVENELLATKHFILLDDTSRDGEKEIIKFWQKRHDYTFKSVGGSFSIALKGNHFNYDLF